MKKKTIRWIALLAAVAVALFLLWKFVFSDDENADGEGAVYVMSVQELTGGGAMGAWNRFGGVAEAQETWSVNQNADSTVKEILVEVGDEVKEGQPLFTYDIEKYQNDQEQAQIELERMQNELEALEKAIAELETEKRKAAASAQADYEIRIQDAELQKKQKELDIRSKNLSIAKLQENQENATVVSEIDGVVRSINDGTGNQNFDTSENNAFITIMKTGDLRIKGTINEQNIGQITVGAPVLIHSRVDASQTWTGSISEINTDSTVSTQNMYYYGGGSEGSSNYHFYVTLDDSAGLMIGQHVYLELDVGQEEIVADDMLRIPSYFVAYTEEGEPFVWKADAKGKLQRQEITIGEEDEELMLIEVLEGLSEEDAIAYPEENLQEGMATLPGGQS